MILPLLWLVLYHAKLSRSSLMDFDTFNNAEEEHEILPINLNMDPDSGCLCRATRGFKTIVCFGHTLCKKFPKVTIKSEVLRVRTTVILGVYNGQLDKLTYLRALQIESNHQLKYIEPGCFSNLTNLTELSISYNPSLQALDARTFKGLRSLRNLTLVNNGFTNIKSLTPAFRPSILPSLKGLDLSANSFEEIPEDAFVTMESTQLKRLEIDLCRIDFIHPASLLPLKMLKKLRVGENDLNSTMIGKFLTEMINNGVNLTLFDLSGMGFRRTPPRHLLDIIAKSSIKELILSKNQFEIISDDTFPKMENIEILDLRRVLAIHIGPYTFSPEKFPNLKVLLLGENCLPGLHGSHLSNQLLYLDLSNNRGKPTGSMYFEIGEHAFDQSRELKQLDLSDNNVKSIFNYTFRGLDKLQNLNLRNSILYRIGGGTFRSTKRLTMLNLENNPLTLTQNLTSCQFDGLNALKVLIIKKCGIKQFDDDDNIFEMMPNLTHLIVANNLLNYLTAETLKPMKYLQYLDLRDNLLVSWWRPLFFAAVVKPYYLNLRNNKITHFTQSMIQDMNYLLEDKVNSTKIDLMNNIFVCDCNTMYRTASWLKVNGSALLMDYFENSKFQCSSPDAWEYKRVAEYLASIKVHHCLDYDKITSVTVLIWTAPSFMMIILVLAIATTLYKCRMYIRYWIFLAKLYLGRKFLGRSMNLDSSVKEYKYDAFVSYCYEDSDFVVDMIDNLEKKPPYLKLCISERDFEIGAFISEAIINSVNDSKYIILVVSNNFAKSHWCRWETQLAEYHRLFIEGGSPYDPLVLIRIGEVENKYMTTTLKYLLKTKIYLMWNENRAEDFWKKLRNVLTKKK